MTSLILTAAFAAAGGLTGFGIGAWRTLQRVGTQLQGVNPDLAGKEIHPVRASIVGAFLGAALGFGGTYAVENHVALLSEVGNTSIVKACSIQMASGLPKRLEEAADGSWHCVPR